MAKHKTETNDETPTPPPVTSDATEPDPPKTGSTSAPRADYAPKPTRGRILDFTNREGDVVPAIVTKVEGAELHLHTFHSLYGGQLECVDIAGAERAAPGEPSTWNWPVRQ